jgi:fido (protein-threonine AMPylation protein)
MDDEPSRRDEIARLVELAIDELLVGLVTQERLHPKHLRELHRPWRALMG